MTWRNYDISENYQGRANQLLPNEYKFRSGMIIGRDADLTNTKRVKLKTSLKLNKSIKYTVKSILNVELPHTLKMDVDSNNDISFVFHSTTDAPSQIISETDISFGSSVSDTKKDDMILYNIIGLENPSIIGRDLSGSSIRHLDNLQGIDFSGSNLSYIDFKSKNLTDCNFSFTNLFHTDFSGATLTNCIFTGASINMTNFTQTIGLSTLTFGVDNTNSKIVLEDLSYCNIAY